VILGLGLLGLVVEILVVDCLGVSYLVNADDEWADVRKLLELLEHGSGHHCDDKSHDEYSYLEVGVCNEWIAVLLKVASAGFRNFGMFGLRFHLNVLSNVGAVRLVQRQKSRRTRSEERCVGKEWR